MTSSTYSGSNLLKLLMSVLVLSVCVLTVADFAEAKTIKRGVQTAPLEIQWTIIGGSGTCDGTFDGIAYQNASDTISTQWLTSHAQSQSPLRLVAAGGTVYHAGTYTFRCTDASSGKADTDILVIDDCAASEYWNGSNCVPKVPPSVTTNPADAISVSQATLNSTVNPNGSVTNVVYRYGTANAACASLPSTANAGSAGTGISGVSMQTTISSLSANTTYYFCATASNGYGTTNGSVRSFTTQAANAPTLSNADTSTGVVIGVGGSVTRTSTANDANSNLVQHELAWTNPNGTNSWDSGAPWSLGATTGSGPHFTFAPTATDARTISFTPAMLGVYNTWWKASDNTGLDSYSAGRTVTVRCPDGNYYDGSGYSASDCVASSNATGPGGYPGNPYGELTCTYGGTPPSCSAAPQLAQPTVSSLTPVNLHCSISNGGKSEIQWSASPNADLYRIEQTNTNTNAIVEYTQSASVQRKFTTPDNTLIDGNVYSYRVRAEAVGYTASAWSVPQNLRACAPATPLNLVATASCPAGGVKLDWVPGAYGPDPEWRGFKVYRDGVLIASNYGSQSASTYTDVTGNTGVPYRYKVIAQSKHDSFDSNEVMGTAPDCGGMNLTSEQAGIQINGSPNVNQTVTFRGRVRNSGSLPVNTPFSDDFSYCWGAGCTNFNGNRIGNHIPKSTVPFPPGSISDDISANFLLSQSGTLRIQHCVDSLWQINEPGAESDNCAVRDFLITGGPMVNGMCGPAAMPPPKRYSYTDAGFSGPLCGPGNLPNPVNPTFPAPQGSTSWVCKGSGGGIDSPQCTATRAGGTISATPCRIPVNQSTCDILLAWNASYTVSPFAEVWVGSSMLPTVGPNNSGYPYQVTQGSYLYTLRDGPDILDGGSLTINCENGSTWSGGVCVSTMVPPTLRITKGAAPVTIVNMNDSVDVEWNTNNGDETACKLTGGGLNYIPLPAKTGSVSKQIIGRVTFTLECPGGSVAKTIDVRPQGWES